MAKKENNKSMGNDTNNKSIEEFLFAVNLSAKIIKESLTNTEYDSSQASKEELEKQLQFMVESFYRRNKQFLYAETDLLLTDRVKIDELVITDIFSKGFHLDGVCYKPSMEVNKKDEMIDGDEEMDAKFDAAHAIFLEKEYETSTPEYIIIKGYSSFYDLFRSEQFIEKLYQNVKDNLKQISSKTDYLSSLQSIDVYNN